MPQIEPFASLVNTVRSTVPRLLLNRHAVGPFERVPLRRGDHMELGDLVATVRRFAEMLGWNSEIEELMSAQETQVGSIFFPVLCRNVAKEQGEPVFSKIPPEFADAVCSITFLQSIPVLISSSPSLSSQTHESGSTDSPRKMEARGDGARSNGEESDSETDSKSSTSSTLSS